MRRDLRRGGNAISFFAFQDIITSVIGILLFITLLLSMFIGMSGPVESTTEDARQPATPAQLARLEVLLAEIVDAENRLREASAGAAAFSEAEIIALEKEIEILASRLAATRPSLPTDGTSDQARREVVVMQAAIDELRASLAAIEEQAEARRRQVADAQRRLEEAQQAKLAEEKNRNDLFVIPEKARTTKSPLLLDVKDSALTLQGLDGSKVQARSSSSGDLRALLSGFPKTEYYIVAYYRPSTFHLADSINDTLRSLGFEIGYDILRNEQNVILGTGSP